GKTAAPRWGGAPPRIRSDAPRPPPVTADRSPPASRMTGADSPVIADSSTDATPSVISPSEGMTSPGSQTTRSPLASSAAAIRSSLPPGRSRRASVSERIRRSVSAWALPRPSATASAKLANTTVSARLNVTDQAKHWGGPPTRPALPACRSRPRTLPGSLPGPGGRACAARQPPRGREWRGRTALRRSAGQWAGPSRCPCPARSRRPWRSAQNPQRRTFKAPHAKAARPPATRCGEGPNGAWAAARRAPAAPVDYEDRAAGLSHQLIRQAAEQQDADRLPGAARYHHDLGAPRVRLGHDDAGDLGAGCVDDHAARWHAVGPDAGQRLVQHRGGLLTSLVIE